VGKLLHLLFRGFTFYSNYSVRPKTGDRKPAPKSRGPKFPYNVKRLRACASGKLRSSVLKQILLNGYILH